MRRPRLLLRAMPALSLGFALSYASTSLLAQGLPPSSGSGAGTGTGRESSSGLGTTGSGRESTTTRPLQRSSTSEDPRQKNDPRRPGARESRPPGISTVTPELLIDARSIRNPGERALALIRVGQTTTFADQLGEAHSALFEAGTAALTETDPLIREQRLTATVFALLELAERRMDAPTIPEGSPLSPTPPPPPIPTPAGPASTAVNVPTSPTSLDAIPDQGRQHKLREASEEWDKAVELARQIEAVKARTEVVARIVDSEANSSWKLVNNRVKQVVGSLPDPTKLDPTLRTYADNLLVSAANLAVSIERPIWRDYATFTVVANAAASSQFTRGFQIARSIVQPEARTNALIRLAEGQALNGHPSEATAAYEEAANSVALVPQTDPRETLIGVLIDSLISFGRFDDARACVPLYSFPSRQLVALSAIAESQGRRGLAESARIWIATENPSFQPLLYRKVNDGLLALIQQNKSKLDSGRQ